MANIIHHLSNGAGLAELYDGDTLKQGDLLVCPHCNKGFKISRSKPQAICKRHMKPVCESCATKPCTDFMKKLEAYEKGLISVLR